jgi:hypothetical protein
MGMVFSQSHVGYFAPRDPWPSSPRSLTLRNDRHGLYRYDRRFEDPDLLLPQRGGPYSFWSSVKYIFILSVMLWWIPAFGQMIAGYVGGRKAGNHWKAAAAAVLPVVLIWVLSLLAYSTAAFPELANLVALPAMAAYGLGEAIPIFDPYIRLIIDYLASFLIALRETVGMGLNGYLVTIIFAYIGGLIADQTSKEREVVRQEEPPVVYERGLPPPEAPYPRTRPALASGPAGWYRVHRERFDHLRRIPVAPYGYEEVEEYYEPPTRPAQRRLVDSYPPREAYEDLERRREPPRRSRRLDKEELIRRLVERALREYDRSVNRDVSSR